MRFHLIVGRFIINQQGRLRLKVGVADVATFGRYLPMLTPLQDRQLGSIQGGATVPALLASAQHTLRAFFESPSTLSLSFCAKSCLIIVGVPSPLLCSGPRRGPHRRQSCVKTDSSKSKKM